MTRQQIFHLVGVRPTSSQRVRLGAGRDGRLVAIAHEVNMYTSPHEEYAEQTAATARGLYAAPNRLTRHRLTPLDLPRGEDVRAPGEAPGLLAVESAMDELAHALGMDPVELRIRNEPTVDPERGVPFSDRRLVECMREGARRFGWERRPTQPASLREGRWLVGYGMAAAIRMHFQAPTKARVRMGPDGIAVVQSDMTDIGDRHLHDPDPGRGRSARAAGRSRAGRARAVRVSCQLGVGRLLGRQQHEQRRPARMRSAAREAAGLCPRQIRAAVRDRRTELSRGPGGGGRDRRHGDPRHRERAELQRLLDP